MRVLVNGEAARAARRARRCRRLVATLGGGDRGVAVAVGEEVVPRSDWATRRCDEGARVEVLTAVQGG